MVSCVLPIFFRSNFEIVIHHELLVCYTCRKDIYWWLMVTDFLGDSYDENCPFIRSTYKTIAEKVKVFDYE